MSAAGAKIATGFPVEYWADGRARSPACGPLIYGSCGVGEPLRSASVAFDTDLRITDQWHLASTTTPQGAVAGNRCTITALNFDVTNLVLGRFNAAMAAAASRIDQQLASAADLRSRVESIWAELQSPIEVSPDAWLALRPVGLGVSQLEGSPDQFKIRVQLRAKPEITYGAKPAPSQAPLPAREPPAAGDLFALTVPIAAPYAVISDQAKRHLKLESGGIRYPATGKYYLRPVDVEVYGYGAKAVLRLKLDGSAKGVIYLVGTPTWDAGHNVLSFPDLAYTLETKNALLTLVNWVEGDNLLEDLKHRLVFEMDSQMSAARATANAALNRKLARLSMSGTVSSMSILGFYADPKQGTFKLLANAIGSVAVALNP